MAAAIWNNSIVLLPIFIGSILLLAGIAKLIAGSRSFAQTVLNYRLLPAWLATFTARTIIIAELGVGGFLFARAMLSVAAIIAAILFATFALGVIVNLAKGRTDISCGCFGATESRISWVLATRNIVAACCALLVMMTPQTTRPSHFYKLDGHLTVIGVLGIYMLLKALMKLCRPSVGAERAASA